MSDYLRNFKSAIRKMGKDQSIAGNQLIFKEKEALILTGTFVSIPIVSIAIAYLLKSA